MKKNSFVFSVAVAVLCVAVFSTMAVAGGNKAPGPNTQGVQVAQSADAPLTVNHVLKKTYINSGIPSLAIAAATFTPLDTPVGAVCPGTAGTCTLLVDAFATSNGTGNRALCVVIGGIVGACPYSGKADGTFSQIHNSEVALTIPLGTTTAQVVVFSDTAAVVYTYRTTYRVYKP